MSGEITPSIQRAVACIAFRHIDEACTDEREQILIALIEALPETEAKLAQDALFHLREANKAQMQLALVLDFKRRVG